MERLFVPLNTEPWKWFRAGVKTHELRRAKGAFALKHMVLGREVELRRGYSTPDKLFGVIASWCCSPDIETVLKEVGFRNVMPMAETLEQAIERAKSILGPDESTAFIAFEVGAITHQQSKE